VHGYDGGFTAMPPICTVGQSVCQLNWPQSLNPVPRPGCIMTHCTTCACVCPLTGDCGKPELSCIDDGGFVIYNVDQI